jgi:hypothetical protein
MIDGAFVEMASGSKVNKLQKGLDSTELWAVKGKNGKARENLTLVSVSQQIPPEKQPASSTRRQVSHFRKSFECSADVRRRNEFGALRVSIGRTGNSGTEPSGILKASGNHGLLQISQRLHRLSFLRLAW